MIIPVRICDQFKFPIFVDREPTCIIPCILSQATTKNEKTKKQIADAILKTDFHMPLFFLISLILEFIIYLENYPAYAG